MLIDTHAHIHDAAFRGETEALLGRAKAAGVTTIVDVGCDYETTDQAVALAARHPEVWAVIGIHPHEADRYRADERLDGLRRHASDPRVVAVGEIGLDYAKMHSSKEGQLDLFRRQLRLAREIAKPVVIHCRDAYGDCLTVLREEMAAPVRGVMHCFSGTVEDAKGFLELGFVISIAGPVTFANAEGLRQVAAFVPIDRVVVETDCPYLTPVPHRGKRNEPAFVRHTAEQVAKKKGVSLERFAEASTETARRLFELP